MSIKPEPTKAYAIYMDGEWYGEGDTASGAWNDVRRQVGAGYSREGNIMFAKIRRYGHARKVMTREEHEARCVANYVAEGLGEW